MTTRIRAVIAWAALDSRGRPTVAARVELAGGAAATALAPSGASAGSHEAHELRDGGDGRAAFGVDRAVANVGALVAPALIGEDAAAPQLIDDLLVELDGTPNLTRIGGNTAIAVSTAVTLAVAADAGTSMARWLQPTGPLLLPLPMVNIVSGGAHAREGIDIQDVLVVPHGARSFAEAIRWCAEVRDAAAALAVDQGLPGASLVADEGGVGVRFPSNEDALRFTVRAVERSGHVPGTDLSLAVDLAATQLFDGHGYRFDRERHTRTAEEMIDLVERWSAELPLVSVEDPLAEDAWADWSELERRVGGRLQLVGDDHFVTDLTRLERGIEARSANAVLVKVNQNGLVSRTRQVLERAQRAGMATIVSARSGDTEQAWLSDLAVGWRAGQIKVGSTHRSERTAKWNRLLELEATEETEFNRSALARQNPGSGRW